jgi:hypothetical protein
MAKGKPAVGATAVPIISRVMPWRNRSFTAMSVTCLHPALTPKDSDALDKYLLKWSQFPPKATVHLHIVLNLEYLQVIVCLKQSILAFRIQRGPKGKGWPKGSMLRALFEDGSFNKVSVLGAATDSALDIYQSTGLLVANLYSLVYPIEFDNACNHYQDQVISLYR